MDLTDIIYSNDYINILIQNYVAQSERYQMLFPESSALLTLNPQYSVLFLERSLLPENLFGAVPFTGLPKLFTPLSTLSLEVSGIVQTQNLYGGGYTGKNVIFGFLDTGIDYRHPAFLHANGQSRILAVWDQTDWTGTPPAIHSPLFQSPIPTGTARMSQAWPAVLRMPPPDFSASHRRQILPLLN